MIKVLVVEDEYLNAVHLKALLQESSYDIQIIEVIDSIKKLMAFLEKNKVDLIFLDIHLSDGISTEYFDKIGLDTSVIFTTAYQEYVIDSFKTDNIGYLLKPIKSQELYESIDKFISMKKESSDKYRDKFIIKYTNKLLNISANEISFFFSEYGIVYINTFDNKKYILNKSLNKLDEELNPNIFFRVNRSHIVNIKAISDIKNYVNQRLEFRINQRENTIVSRERVKNFKNWLES